MIDFKSKLKIEFDLISYFRGIKSSQSYYACLLLIVYLCALFPKDLSHKHKLNLDETHTAAEHCENVIYNAPVSAAHKCAHKSHLSSSRSHCFACDNHCTSLHTEHELFSFSNSSQIISESYLYQISMRKILSSGIYNKGPPRLS
jgi:hypothetical protein